MAVDAKLNAAWATNTTMDAVFEVRAICQNMNDQIVEATARLATIVAAASFAGVDAEIKSAGQACIVALNNAKTALAAQALFLNWTPS
jgi:hypothetical protein